MAALLIIGTFTLWLFQLTASANTSSLAHFYSMGAFYAAESGLEMGLRELTWSPPTDIDSDGLVGTISNNGNPGDDPALATGVFYVECVGANPASYRSTGRPAQSATPFNAFRRIVEVHLR